MAGDLTGPGRGTPGTDERAQADAELLESLLGRTVEGVEWRTPAADASTWGEHSRARLTFDDGRTIEFGGWGYDAWGVILGEVADGSSSYEDHVDQQLHDHESYLDTLP